MTVGDDVFLGKVLMAAVTIGSRGRKLRLLLVSRNRRIGRRDEK